MKISTKITAIILCSALLASCSHADEENTRETTEKTTAATETSESETTEATTTTTEATTTATTEETTESEEPRVYTSDIDSQLQLIADSYDMLSQEAEDNWLIMGPMFAVTDLDHDCRLELILSDIQGSGCFSYNRFYEVSEDYSSLVLMNVNGEAQTDELGDITIPRDGDGVVVYNCYTLNGEYYYEIGDYASAGWDYKNYAHYSYHIGDEVVREFIGGCSVSHDYETDNCNVWLVGPDDVLFEDNESYFRCLESYWNGYERQSNCAVQWMDLEEDGFAEAVAASYEGFDPESDREVADTNDYREYFAGFYGEDREYTIQTE